MSQQRVAIWVPKSDHLKTVKTQLESHGHLNKNLKIKPENGGFLVFSTLESIDLDDYFTVGQLKSQYYEYEEFKTDVRDIFRTVLKKYVDGGVFVQLESLVPNKWQVYPPMVLLQANSVETEIFQNLLKNIDSDLFWSEILAKCWKNCTHILVNKPIVETANEKRIPYNIVTIHGDFGPPVTNESLESPSEADFNDLFWCSVVQNKVLQTWAPRYTMFSRGNIVEKQRVLAFTDVKDTVVADLYSGIGYFTLHYLANKPRHCFCWEINPWSNQGLIRSLKQQGVSFKLIRRNEPFTLDPSITVYIFQESNEHCVERLANLKFPISHINLGLLPTSTEIWPAMLQLCALNSTSPTKLHIHENCHREKLTTFLDEISVSLNSLLRQLSRSTQLNNGSVSNDFHSDAINGSNQLHDINLTRSVQLHTDNKIDGSTQLHFNNVSARSHAHDFPDTTPFLDILEVAPITSNDFLSKFPTNPSKCQSIDNKSMSTPLDVSNSINTRLSFDRALVITSIQLNKVKTYAPDVWHVVCDFIVH